MYKILGKNDEQTTCDACGKRNLKLTVVLESETGNIVRYGVDCAAMALKGNKKSATAKTVLNQATVIEQVKRWLANGYSAEIAARGIWNRFGYCAEARGNTVLVQIERVDYKWWTNAIISAETVEYQTLHVAR